MVEGEQSYEDIWVGYKCLGHRIEQHMKEEDVRRNR